jgi:hypothetical protein
LVCTITILSYLNFLGGTGYEMGVWTNLWVIDVIGDKIYITCHINYIVKGDPEQREVSIPAAGVFRLMSGSEQERVFNGEGKEERDGLVKRGEERVWGAVLEGFNVYLDIGPVLKRGEEVTALKS